MSSKVIVKDRGFQAAVGRITALDKRSVRVGIHESAGEDLVLIAEVHEFGSKDGHIPQRSFLRATFDAQEAELAKVRTEIAGFVADGIVTPDQGLRHIGNWFKSAVKRRIRGGIPPPNAPATIAAKGSSTTLIDTGRLIGAITVDIVKEP